MKPDQPDSMVSSRCLDKSRMIMSSGSSWPWLIKLPIVTPPRPPQSRIVRREQKELHGERDDERESIEKSPQQQTI
jgi:hypothetical protein